VQSWRSRPGRRRACASSRTDYRRKRRSALRRHKSFGSVDVDSGRADGQRRLVDCLWPPERAELPERARPGYSGSYARYVANVFVKSGVQVPPGVSPRIAILQACGQRSDDCQKIARAVSANTATAMRADISGKATLPGVPPGTYYLSASGMYNKQSLYWEVRVDLKPGTNSVTLDLRNAIPLKVSAQNPPD